MEATQSVWSYQQAIIEELKHSLLCTTLELESIQLSAKEEKRKAEENMKQLLQILKVAFDERDEAKDKLQRLLNKLTQSTTTQLYHCLPNLQPECPAIITTKGNASITESDSLSENYNHHSNVSSSAMDYGVSSPDFSNINMADSSNIGLHNQPILQEFNGSSLRGINSGMSQSDPTLTKIDRIAMMKSLPEKGKLLKAVLEAGPLLQTLLVAGPLPRWRNPPPTQSFQIPPVSIKAQENVTLAPTPIVNPNFPVQSSLSPCDGISNCASQTCSTSILNFSNTVGSCGMKRPMLYSGSDNNLCLAEKRQKFQ
ncbi:uncharacterized protein LOC143848649 [Tasmannia lanceolata]|uniref:uncharacterized protein LOC143848649 n=1 Tax=Tasmannia lanceolata TaxID=3420 RepID=UPI004062828D